MTERTERALAYSFHSGGPPESGRPPLFLIHGAGGGRLDWPPELRSLEGKDVYAFDLPGHGDSPPSGPATIGAFAERLIDMAGAIGIRRAVWVGHSMGAAVALTAALRRPRLVAGLVLIGASAAFRVDPRLLQLLEDPRQFPRSVEKLLRGFFSPEAAPGLVEAARGRLLEAGPAQVWRDFLACDRFDLRARVGQIAAPALVISGGADVMTRPEEGRALAERLPAGRFELIPGAGHRVMEERVGEVVALMGGFLGSGEGLVT